MSDSSPSKQQTIPPLPKPDGYDRRVEGHYSAAAMLEFAAIAAINARRESREQIDRLQQDAARDANSRVVMSIEMEELRKKNDELRLAERLNVDTVARLQQERDDLRQFHDWAFPQITGLGRAQPPTDDPFQDRVAKWMVTRPLPGPSETKEADPKCVECNATTADDCYFNDELPPPALCKFKSDPFADAPLTGPGSRLEADLVKVRADRCTGPCRLESGGPACGDCGYSKSQQKRITEQRGDDWCPQCAKPRGECVCAGETPEPVRMSASEEAVFAKVHKSHMIDPGWLADETGGSRD